MHLALGWAASSNHSAAMQDGFGNDFGQVDFGEIIMSYCRLIQDCQRARAICCNRFNKWAGQGMNNKFSLIARYGMQTAEKTGKRTA